MPEQPEPFLYTFYNDKTGQTAIFVNIDPPERIYPAGYGGSDETDWISELLLTASGEELEWGGDETFGGNGVWHLPAETIPGFLCFFQSLSGVKGKSYRWIEPKARNARRVAARRTIHRAPRNVRRVAARTAVLRAFRNLAERTV